MLINTYFKENREVGPRAEVYQGPNGYYIEYYDASGMMITKETFDNKSIYYVNDAAENWANGIKKLYG